jgi:hypothetical protein
MQQHQLTTNGLQWSKPTDARRTKVSDHLLAVMCAHNTFSDTTRERFIQSYSFPDNLRLSSCYDALVSSILGLVRLLQLSLFFFEKFDVESYKCDGLLCDYTLEGLERWTEEIGEPKLLLEVGV